MPLVNAEFGRFPGSIRDELSRVEWTDRTPRVTREGASGLADAVLPVA